MNDYNDDLSNRVWNHPRSPMLDRIIREAEFRFFRRVIIDTIAFVVLVAALLWIFAAPTNARGDDWTRGDTAMEAAVITVIAVDWMQTSNFANRPDEFYEMNPILGSFPSQTRINLTIGATMIAHAVIARALPQPYRRAFQAITIAMELGATSNNAMNGVGLSLPW